VEYTLGGASLAGYLLALGRTAGFVLIAPPFSTRAVPQQVRAAVALTLAIPLATWTTAQAPSLTSAALVTQLLLQLVTGATLGFIVTLAVAVIQTIGDIIDVTGGFSLSLGMDPLMLNQSSVMGRLHQLLAVTLLFGGSGHLIVLQGLSRSLQLAPEAALNWEGIAQLIARNVSSMFLGAVQITAPIMAALLIADLALGLLTRAAPALNAFSLAFPLKILLSVLLIGLVLMQVPGVLDRLIDRAGTSMIQIAGG
jgi:flagellar biosynthetic protein FliR